MVQKTDIKNICLELVSALTLHLYKVSLIFTISIHNAVGQQLTMKMKFLKVKLKKLYLSVNEQLQIKS